jgi:membrane associated rhomboid family serine protease
VVGTLLLVGTLYLAFMAGVISQRAIPTEFRSSLPITTAVVFGVTACLSGLQFIFPAILADLRRNGELFTSGQWWRLLTPLFVQDGGLPGTVFNLLSLSALGLAAERLLGWRRWLLLYFGTGVVSEIIAYTLLPQGSAGNSIANFGLAAGLLVVGLTSRLHAGILVAALGSLCGLALLAMGDLHDAAFLVGSLLAVGAAAVTRKPLNRASLL